jgi:hypothetical protein
MQIRCPGCVPRNYLNLWYSMLSLETASKDNLSDFGLVCAAGISRAISPSFLTRLGLPYVQIEAIVEAHNFGSQTFAIRVLLSLWICTERSWCSRLREYLSGWVDLVGNCFGHLELWSLHVLSLDLWRASWSSHKVLDELISKVSSSTLISCVNNKLQKPHARVNLLHH